MVPVLAGGGLGLPTAWCPALPGGQLVGAADVVHADVVVIHALDIADEVGLQQLHKEADLGLGATEIVLKREGVEGEEGQIDAGGGFYDELDAFSALLVAEEAFEGALAGPAAVAIHDDGDVLRVAGGIKLPVDGGFVRGEFVETAWGSAWHVDGDAAGCGCAQSDLAKDDASIPG